MVYKKYCLGKLLNCAAFVPLFEILIHDLSNTNPEIVEFSTGIVNYKHTAIAKY